MKTETKHGWYVIITILLCIITAITFIAILSHEYPKDNRPQLIYHGEIITIRPTVSGFNGTKLIIITPDTQYQLVSPSIGLYEDGDIIPISKYSIWDGNVESVTPINGIYWVYHQDGQDFNTILSKYKITDWNNNLKSSEHNIY